MCIIFYSCGPSKHEPTAQERESIKKSYPVIGKIGTYRGCGMLNIRLYVIDSCEYIGNIDESSHDFLTHKGNCKFCIERRKTGE